ncbi:MAG: lipid II flippase MurJ [Patescibacteria group bacterium]|nr:lipid II flippase MurJ [Patescibacteria group bacterium]
MVKKIWNFLNKEFHGVNEAALLLGGFAFASQLLGLIRDRLLAHNVGAGPILDVYYAAFRIPDFLYVSIASLASITVLMPFLVERLKNGNNKLEAKRFLNNVFSAYMIFMFLASIVLFILMPYITNYIAPGFSDQQMLSLIKISRLMLLSPIFIGLSNLIGTITQLFKNFFAFSLSPVFYNLGIIIGIIFLYPFFGLSGLAIGVVIGAILHMSIQIPTIIRHGFFPKFKLKIDWPEIYKVIKLSLPRTLTLSAGSLAFIALVAMASNLEDGSISLFTLSFNLQSVPVGIIGISYSVAAFPILVQSFSKKDMNNFIKQIISTMKQIIFWSFPIITLMIVLRAQIVRVVLGSGNFTWSDTRLTAASVALFVISLITQSLVLLFIRGYYAAGNTKKPLIINVFSSILIVVFAYSLIQVFELFPELLKQLEILLRVKGVEGTTMLALPIAYTLGSIINFTMIWKLFKKDFLRKRRTGVRATFFDVTAASLVMGIVAYLILNVLSNVFNLEIFFGIFLQGFIAGIIGIAVGVFVLVLLKNKELLALSKAIKKKFWRNRIVSPEQQGL